MFKGCFQQMVWEFFCVDGSSHNFDAVLAHSLLYFKGYFYEVSVFLIFEDI